MKAVTYTAETIYTENGLRKTYLINPWPGFLGRMVDYTTIFTKPCEYITFSSRPNIEIESSTLFIPSHRPFTIDVRQDPLMWKNIEGILLYFSDIEIEIEEDIEYIITGKDALVYISERAPVYKIADHMTIGKWSKMFVTTGLSYRVPLEDLWEFESIFQKTGKTTIEADFFQQPGIIL